MGLVDYSDSESESDVAVGKKEDARAAVAGGSKKGFQKLVDRSNAGKILVNLPTATASADEPRTDDGPPAKRAKTQGGGRFSGFSSFLPPPKKTTAAAPTASGAQPGSTKLVPRPGVHLKTGAEPAFSRESYGSAGEEVDGEDESGSGGQSARLSLPPPRSTSQPQPSILPGLKPADEVKLVGKPLLFKPLSVARKPAQKKKAASAKAQGAASAKLLEKQEDAPADGGADPVKAAKEAAPKAKVSLFSLSDDSATLSPVAEPATSGYKPMFDGYDGEEDGPPNDDDFPAEDAPSDAPYSSDAQSALMQQQPQQFAPSLDSVASDMNLSAAARRELFGRHGAASARSTVASFDMEREYEHNEAVRAAAGDQQQSFNPVRAIAPGKHSLRQIVNAVQNQTAALEESFAQNRTTRREAAGRYGWK